MRVRVGRNLASFPLPGAMTLDDRLAFEKEMVKAFEKLMKDPAYGGTYYSLTPGTKYSISDEKYKELVKAHVMFKDMADDSYLASAGIASDWPYGRGCYQSEDKQFIVWVGEEDQLRIMCMKKGTVLNEVFDRLRTACDVVEATAGKFAHSESYGYVTSCPSNLGTGMRASVHIKVPNLTSDGTDKKAKAICKPLGLSVRGVGGEHTPIGADGTIDLSPSARLCIEEAEIICALYQGIERLLEQEKQAKL
jgi:creatine kinase